ncbi:MAG: 1-(5-phosphoribosyl)-5-amino-4-imidazole-carboxylate carboxylase [Deltaproteobacteria bacterium]|nr:1-(5-phosphoribosyl)-5-amino-4-imidazole-carboxylate carboxylase [Deltaproteobacteria bacterium]
MTLRSLESLFEAVAEGSLSPAEASLKARSARLEFAHLDLDRPRRTGEPEVVFGSHKSAEQIVPLLEQIAATGQPALATRISPDKARAICAALPAAEHHPTARAVVVRPAATVEPVGHIAVVCAGTSDLPVADEAAITAELFGSKVVRHTDIGVAGLHRMLSRLDTLREARVLVVVAGMEGALPTVLAGLVRAPVVAVPTSVGYGAHLHGVTPMLGMLTACAPGISVVNIDNGFGAAVVAHRINRLGAP